MPVIILFLSLLVPSVAFAATFKDIVRELISVINLAIPIVGGLVLLAFFWGVARYVFSSADSSEKGRGKELIVWGLVAIFVVFSIYGIVAILQNTLIR